MSDWEAKFREKHSKDMHPDVLNRIDFRVMPETNIARKQKELSTIEAGVIRNTQKVAEKREQVVKRLEQWQRETGEFSLRDNDPVALEYEALQTELKHDDILASETCQLIVALEEEITQCESA
jgi:recombinational DNA repair ATPase RecF